MLSLKNYPGYNENVDWDQIIRDDDDTDKLENTRHLLKQKKKYYYLSNEQSIYCAFKVFYEKDNERCLKFPYLIVGNKSIMTKILTTLQLDSTFRVKQLTKDLKKTVEIVKTFDDYNKLVKSIEENKEKHMTTNKEVL